jgi:hypothetical protein
MQEEFWTEEIPRTKIKILEPFAITLYIIIRIFWYISIRLFILGLSIDILRFILRNVVK